MNRKKLINALMAILGAVFLFSFCAVVYYGIEAAMSETLYDELSDMVHNPGEDPPPSIHYEPSRPTDPAPTDPTVPSVDYGDIPTLPVLPEPEDSPMILSEYVRLYMRNNDLVGWITIEGTNIDYPVLQTFDDPEFYLNHDFDGNYSRRGCIFAAADCDVFSPSDNVILYGHHMADGSMFGNLVYYTSRSFWSSHRYITFDTILEYHSYEIIAVFHTSGTAGLGFAYHTFFNAASQEEFDRFVSTCKSLSYYDTGLTAQYGDSLLCLSTCEYTIENGRLVVVAKRIS